MQLTSTTFRAAPRSLDLGLDFGMRDDELEEFSNKVGQAGIPCFEGGVFDPTCLANIDVEDLMKALPALQQLGINLGDLESLIPPGLLEDLREAGLLDDAASGEQGGGGS